MSPTSHGMPDHPDASTTAGDRAGWRSASGRLVSGLANLVAAISLFGLMVLSFADVVGRSLFNRPLPGTMELTELLMALLIFALLPSLSRRGEQIAVDLLDAYVPPSVRVAQRLFANALGVVTFAVIAWQLWDDAAKLASYGGTTAYLNLPLSPFIQVMAVLAAATALGFLGAMLAVRRSPS